MRGAAGGDEVVAERVHEVQQARGAVRVPPGRRELLEVRHLGRADGGAGEAAAGGRRSGGMTGWGELEQAPAGPA